MKIIITGKPIPKARARTIRQGRFVRTYDPQHEEKKVVRLLIKDQMPDGFHLFDEPLKVKMYFYLPIPKSYSKKKRAEIERGEWHHTKKPDVDNLCKYYLDCMNSLIYKDDSCIVALEAQKLYSAEPRTVIEICLI